MPAERWPARWAPALAVALCLLAVTPARAFECARATTPVEQAICADRDLKALDDRLGTVYAEARAQTAKTRRPGVAQQHPYFHGFLHDCSSSKTSDAQHCAKKAHPLVVQHNCLL